MFKVYTVVGVTEYDINVFNFISLCSSKCLSSSGQNVERK